MIDYIPTVFGSHGTNQLMIYFDDRVLLCDYERFRALWVSTNGRMELWWYIRVVFFTSLDDMVVGWCKYIISGSWVGHGPPMKKA